MSQTRGEEQEIGLAKIGEDVDPATVSAEQWKQAYKVTRESGTEPAFKGSYDNFFKNGAYICICCGVELFSSKSKYWSGCGWPAFTDSIDNDLNIIRIADNSHGMERTECNAHLGHVFDDGPNDKERYDQPPYHFL